MRMTRRAMLQQAAVLIASTTRARAADDAFDAFDALGYRRNRYRAVVDRAPDPARRIDLPGVLALGPDALLIDVLPAEGAAHDPQTGQWHLAEPHQTIPGALWYPETGRAPVDPALWHALAARVAAFGRTHPQGQVVVFCRADCWMGWNAARRLALAGWPAIRWFPEGIDGWHDAGRALANVVPARD